MDNSAESRRAEILAKSRQLGDDEGVDFAQTKGSRFSWITLAVVSVPLLIFARMSTLDYVFDIVVSVLVATALASSIAVPISAYRFTKDKRYLAEAGISLFFIITSANRAIHLMMGW